MKPRNIPALTGLSGIDEATTAQLDLSLTGPIALSHSRAMRLVIYDDLFPMQASGFRLAELNAYLDNFPGSRVVVSSLSGPDLHASRVLSHVEMWPAHTGRVHFLAGDPQLGPGDFLYTMFLDNAYDMLALSEGHNIPFGFQLYPGGGFCLDDDESDSKLWRVLESPMFSFVIATQPVTQKYLRDKFNVPPDRIFLIGPGPVWTEGSEDEEAREYFGDGKDTLDVGLIAHKYNNNIKSKGYDFFIEMARSLAKLGEQIHFHVIGTHRPEDYPLDGLDGRITFHGPKESAEFGNACRALDIVVSPNIPSALHKGNFDGFPTASCTQAALVGALIFATDPLNLNTALVPDRDFLLLERDHVDTHQIDVERAAETIGELVADPARLKQLALQGKKAFRALVAPEAQIVPRVALLQKALSGDMPPRGGGLETWRAVVEGASRRQLADRAEIMRLHMIINESTEYIAQKERNIADLTATRNELEEAVVFYRLQSELLNRLKLEALKFIPALKSRFRWIIDAVADVFRSR
jgi:glycosyltransferase involved in cell wall biosynthesis